MCRCGVPAGCERLAEDLADEREGRSFLLGAGSSEGAVYLWDARYPQPGTKLGQGN